MAMQAVPPADPPFIQYLMDPEQEYDCYFMVGKKSDKINVPERVGVVKKMLIAHSLVLRAELQDSKMKEKGVIQVTDLFPETFKNLLRFIYGFDIISTMCFDDADDLFYAADKYIMAGLKSKLATRLSQLLNAENICSLMNNPACYTELELNNTITGILQYETAQVVSSPLFLELTGDAFSRILQQKALSVPEIGLWRSALKWAKHKTDGSDDGQVLRKTLSEQLKHIRILTVSDQELMNEVFNTGIVNGKEIELICMSRNKNKKQDLLVDFCNDIKPRACLLNENLSTLNRLDIICFDIFKGITPYKSKKFSGYFTIITNDFALQLTFALKMIAKKRQDIPKGAKYKSNCTVTLAHITDYENNTSIEEKIVTFSEMVEYNKDYEVPVNASLLARSKYILKIISEIDFYKEYCINYSNKFKPYNNDEILTVLLQEEFDSVTRYKYWSPIRYFSYWLQ